ncbi:MAG: hypothetical protein AAFR07_05595 [Pseudomonadota bacterium]
MDFVLDTLEPELFTPTGKDGADADFSFEIRGLTTSEQLRLPIQKDIENPLFSNAVLLAAFEMGTTRVSNVFVTRNGKREEIRTAKQFAAMPGVVEFVAQAGAQIIAKTYLSEDAEKKSQSPLQ